MNRFFKLYNTKSGYDGTKLHTFFNTLDTINDAKHWLQVDILCARNNDIAGLLHLRYGNNILMLLMVVDKTFNRKISFGNLLVGMCMQNAIENNLRTYDFLKGDEEYKFHWSTDMRTTMSISINQRHPLAILATVGRLMKYAIKTISR